MAAVAMLDFVKAYGREGVKELVRCGELTLDDLSKNYNEGHIGSLLKDERFVRELKKLSRQSK